MSQQSTPRQSIMDEDYDLTTTFIDHLSMPGDEKRRFLAPFIASYEAAYKRNPSKRFKSSEESPSHFNREGVALHKIKADRHFELIQSTIFTSLDVLYTEMEKLQSQMAAISKAITDLTASIPIILKTQLDGVAKKLDILDPAQFPPLEASLEKTVSAVKSAVKETIKIDNSDRLRKFQVFLRNLEPEKDDSTSVKALCERIKAPVPTKLFRLKGEKGIRPLILQFLSPEDAVKFLQCLSTSKRDSNCPHSSLVARPNYTPEEEKTFHQAWAEACKLNDAAGRKEFVVRGLKMVKLDRPGTWTKKERLTTRA